MVEHLLVEEEVEEEAHPSLGEAAEEEVVEEAWSNVCAAYIILP
jgi:hypothetical protein